MSYAPGAPAAVWAIPNDVISAAVKITLMYLWSLADHDIQREPSETSVWVPKRCRADGALMRPVETLLETISEATGSRPSTVKRHLTALRKAGLAIHDGRMVDLYPPTTQGADVRRDVAELHHHVADLSAQMCDETSQVSAMTSQICDETSHICATHTNPPVPPEPPNPPTASADPSPHEQDTHPDHHRPPTRPSEPRGIGAPRRGPEPERERSGDKPRCGDLDPGGNRGECDHALGRGRRREDQRAAPGRPDRVEHEPGTGRHRSPPESHQGASERPWVVGAKRGPAKSLPARDRLNRADLDADQRRADLADQDHGRGPVAQGALFGTPTNPPSKPKLAPTRAQLEAWWGEVVNPTRLETASRYGRKLHPIALSKSRERELRARISDHLRGLSWPEQRERLTHVVKASAATTDTHRGGHTRPTAKNRKGWDSIDALKPGHWLRDRNFARYIEAAPPDPVTNKSDPDGFDVDMTVLDTTPDMAGMPYGRGCR